MRSISNASFRAARVGAVVLLVAGGAALGAVSPAFAQEAPQTVHPNRCGEDPSYSLTGVKGTFVADPGKRVYGQSGVTLSISAASGTTWSGSVTSATQGDINAIIAEAKETVSVSIGYSKTTTVSLGGSWQVPKNQSSGWLALGSEGYTMGWYYGYNNGNCQFVKTKSGTATLPAQTPYIGHS
jgi:hypothetical protein